MYKDEIELMRNKCMNAFSFDIKDVAGLFAFALKHADERPKLKPVDLSVLVDSGIDCEFQYHDSESWFVDRLEFSGSTLLPFKPKTWKSPASRCRPRMNHVYAFHNDFRLPEGLVVRVHFIDGTGKRRTKVYPSDKDPIRETSAENGIVSFAVGVEVLELADNFCWPWEV